MTNTVYKYRLSKRGGTETLLIPRGAAVLGAGFQVEAGYASFFVWCFIDPEAPAVKRAFRVVMTGEALPDDATNWTFVDTIHLHAVELVFHVFDLGERGR